MVRMPNSEVGSCRRTENSQYERGGTCVHLKTPYEPPHILNSQQASTGGYGPAPGPRRSVLHKGIANQIDTAMPFRNL